MPFGPRTNSATPRSRLERPDLLGHRRGCQADRDGGVGDGAVPHDGLERPQVSEFHDRDQVRRSVRKFRTRRTAHAVERRVGPASTLAGVIPPVLTGISLGYFMVLLDLTVLAVAEPDLAASLGASLSGLQWATTAYTVGVRRAAAVGRRRGRPLRRRPVVPRRHRRFHARVPAQRDRAGPADAGRTAGGGRRRGCRLRARLARPDRTPLPGTRRAGPGDLGLGRDQRRGGGPRPGRRRRAGRRPPAGGRCSWSTCRSAWSVLALTRGAAAGPRTAAAGSTGRPSSPPRRAGAGDRRGDRRGRRILGTRRRGRWPAWPPPRCCSVPWNGAARAPVLDRALLRSAGVRAGLLAAARGQLRAHRWPVRAAAAAPAGPAPRAAGDRAGASSR